MMDKIFRSLGGAAALAMTLLVGTYVPVSADDTEIYRAEYDASSDEGRPKVLIVFDDSGSMSDLITEQRPDYDPNATYNTKFPADRIYWTTDGTYPEIGDDRYFSASSNRCGASFTPLSDNGRFTAQHARRWVDSTIETGQCTLECPAGTTYRNPPGPNNAGCYEEITSNEPVAKLVYVRNDWSGNRCYNGLIYVDPPGSNNDACYEWVTSTDPVEGWIYRRNDNRNRCPNGESRLIVDPPGGNNRYDACFELQTAPETETVTEWSYVSDRQQICEPDTAVPGSWQQLSTGDREPTHVECEIDPNTSGAEGKENGPGVSDGYPQDNVLNGDEYGPDVDATLNWGDEVYTFYTSHHLNWKYDDSLVEVRTKLDIAQEVISTIIDTNIGVDFGLMEFNYDEGSRVVQRIIEDMGSTDRSNMVAIIDAMQHSGSTPMCESMYEAFNYLAGNAPVYGNSARSGSDSRGVHDVAPKDSLAESGGTYISPNTDCAFTYIILMTDGEPQRDTGANDNIKTLIEKPNSYDCGEYVGPSGDLAENCMPELAEYMANTDLDGDASNNDQFGITYTIGFRTDQQLLQDTADKGKGTYSTANDAQELTEAFQGALTKILATESTFTSPAVAVDTFTRTQSRNEVFYAMFKPDNSVNWKGNIKKLKLSLSDSEAQLIDADEAAALDASTGKFLDEARTFWSTTADGGYVDEGGVGALLAARDPDTRSILIDTGSGGALEEFNTTNITADALEMANDNALYGAFGAETFSAFQKQVDWARGEDAFDQDGDDNSEEPREWIVGDILHSQPLVINYGGRGSYDEDDPELRIVVGTNAGFVHMFDNADGSESWAFFPKELVSILPERRRNSLSDDHFYGMDLTPVAFTNDVDGDGTLDGNATGAWGDNEDDVWVYMGMRRGGGSYYAINASDPDSPSLMWKISSDTAGFGELGQTWSEPVVTRIPGYTDGDDQPKPVLIFGAGYDTNKDGKSGAGSPDSMGRGIFIVDAETGALIWSVTYGSGAGTETNLVDNGLLHSVPGGVAILDSNGDELTDRLYFADTGGNIWRIDMPGLTLRGSEDTPWQLIKLADFNPNSALSSAADRRFFNVPDVVRIRFKGESVDAVIIGSGDRTNPNGSDVDNFIYMIRDKATAAYATPRPTFAQCSDASLELDDFRCELPLYDDDLFDVSDNTINEGATEAVRAAAIQALGESDGWRLELGNAGEKSLAQTLTINGKVYAPAFTPTTLIEDVNICKPLPGSGLLYVIDLYDAGRDVINLGPIIPDTPSLHFAEDGTIRVVLPPGTPATSIDQPSDIDCRGGICDISENLPSPFGNYWFQESY